MRNPRMDDIFPIIQQLPVLKEKSVLATIIHVEGSAYKKEGSTMLISEDGTMIGILSAGCLEEDLFFKAKEVIKTSKPKVITYDMRDETDSSWGRGAGCNGVITILLQPMTDEVKQNVLLLATSLDANMNVLHVKEFHHNFTFKGESYFPLNDPLNLTFLKNLSLPISMTNLPRKSGLVYSNSSTPLYIHLYRPKPRLILFGAGHDVQPLAKIASLVGFSITLVDWRATLLNNTTFPNVHDFIIGFPEESMKKISFSKNDFVVVMTHDFGRDKEIVSFLMEREIAYLGILGPKERTRRLIGRSKVPEWISSPVGIDIHAEGAEEIAISIVAEMIKVYRENIVGAKEK